MDARTNGRSLWRGIVVLAIVALTSGWALREAAPQSIPLCVANVGSGDDWNEAWMSFGTGSNTESVQIDIKVSTGPFGGTRTLWQNMDVDPNQSGYAYQSDSYFGSDGENVQFWVKPFTGDGQTGTAGSECWSMIGIEDPGM